MTYEIRPEGPTYKIEREVGEGLSARVFKAIREDSRGHAKQIVALKVLKSGTDVSSLRREFETLARINSPHCVRILGWENLEDGCALVLEWIEGVTLYDLAKFKVLPTQIIDEIVAQIYDGLCDLKKSGLFHGDLSPRNVMINTEGTVRLLDFTSLPQGGHLVQGTAAYLAPEIWSGHAGSFEADLFALGLIRHDLCGGRGFATSPGDTEAARLRAFKMAAEGKGLLAYRSDCRRMVGPGSRGASRRQLAALVTDYKILCEGAAGVTRELNLQTNGVSDGGKRTELLRAPHRSITKIAMSFAFLLMALSTPVAADAPLAVDRSSAGGRFAVLQVATQNWFELSINGTPVGYAPVRVERLLPGPHRVQWRNRWGRGETRINLLPGETKLLNESSLLRRAQRGTH